MTSCPSVVTKSPERTPMTTRFPDWWPCASLQFNITAVLKEHFTHSKPTRWMRKNRYNLLWFTVKANRIASRITNDIPERNTNMRVELRLPLMIDFWNGTVIDAENAPSDDILSSGLIVDNRKGLLYLKALSCYYIILSSAQTRNIMWTPHKVIACSVTRISPDNVYAFDANILAVDITGYGHLTSAHSFSSSTLRLLIKLTIRVMWDLFWDPHWTPPEMDRARQWELNCYTSRIRTRTPLHPVWTLSLCSQQYRPNTVLC